MTTTAPPASPAVPPKVTLPTAAFLAAALGGCVVVGGVWAAASLVLGQGRDMALTGLVGAGVVAAAAIVALLGIRPWHAKSLASWPVVWVAGSMLRLAGTLGGAFLLYSSTPFRSKALWFATVAAYVAVMVGETRVYASAMKRYAPLPDPRGSEPSPPE